MSIEYVCVSKKEKERKVKQPLSQNPTFPSSLGSGAYPIHIIVFNYY